MLKSRKNYSSDFEKDVREKKGTRRKRNEDGYTLTSGINCDLGATVGEDRGGEGDPAKIGETQRKGGCDNRNPSLSVRKRGGLVKGLMGRSNSKKFELGLVPRGPF